MERTAQCQCGSLSASVAGEPDFIAVCHCQACQRRTGAVAGSSAYYRRSAVRCEGASKVYVRTAASGLEVRLHFCPECGSGVYWSADFRPDHLGIAVGAFADPSFPPPTVSVWEVTKHDWVSLPATAQRYRQART